MEIFAWAFLGGIVGAALMDVTESYAAKAGISSGVNIALVGRWFLGLLRGQFAHSNILDSKPFPHEINAGWAFHFIVGGGGVALIYPLFFLATGLPFPANHLLGGRCRGFRISESGWRYSRSIDRTRCAGETAAGGRRFPSTRSAACSAWLARDASRPCCRRPKRGRSRQRLARGPLSVGMRAGRRPKAESRKPNGSL